MMMTHLKWGAAALLVFLSAALYGQINFEHTAWKAAADKAAKNNQLLFVDAYATWCGPCKWMASNVFTDKSVGNYFNDNFVNLKLDMETSDGKSFGMKYPVAAYPTFLFIDPKGNIVHKVEGSRPAADFIEEGKKAKGKFKPSNNNNNNAKADDNGFKINFEKTGWQTAHDKARNADKLFFVDAYATWCGPCKWMDKNVFTDKAVGDYFNANFVNMKLDMESADASSFGKKYKIAAYPTFLFIDGQGNIVHKVQGSMGPEDFLAEAKIAQAKPKVNKNPNPNPNNQGGQQEPENTETNYKSEAKTLAKEFSDCLGEGISGIFDKDVLNVLEKLTSMDSEDQMSDYVDGLDEALADRVSEQLDAAEIYTDEHSDCLSNAATRVDDLSKKDANFDESRLEDELFAVLKADKKQRALYLWLLIYSKS